jgi:hypothetical protein
MHSQQWKIFCILRPTLDTETKKRISENVKLCKTLRHSSGITQGGGPFQRSKTFRLLFGEGVPFQRFDPKKYMDKIRKGSKVARHKDLTRTRMNDSSPSKAEIADSTGLKQEKIGTAATTKEPTKAALKLVERAVAIKEDRLGDPAYLARFLIQCTLPHTNPGNVPTWTRKNGQYTLRIQQGWDGLKDEPMGYPYGALPRLILIWAVTEAKRTGIRRLHLGHCLTEFLEKLNLTTSSGRGKRGDATRMKNQARRLFSAHIAFYRYDELKIDGRTVVNERVRQTPITDDMNIAWDRRTADQAVLWGSWIDLSPSFFAAIMESVVPCDMRAIAMLRKSPLALDLYMLCNYIGANLKQREKTKHFLTWRMLGQQLGCDYADQDNLKKKIKATMRKVQLAHPGLRVGYPAKGGGLEIRVSPPAIAPRALKVDLG